MTSETLLQDELVCGNENCDETVFTTTHVTEKSTKYVKSSMCTIVLTSYEEAEDLMTFICHVFSAIDNTTFGYLFWGGSFIVSVIAVVLGVLRYGSCPCEPCVPMFVAVGGCALLLQCVCQGLRCCCRKNKSYDETEPDVLQTLNNIMGILMLFWTIPGAVWIFSIVRKVDTVNPYNVDYCDHLLFWFTFTFVCLIFLVVLSKCSLLITLCCVHNVYEKTSNYANFNDDDDDDEENEDYGSLERSV